MSLSDAQRKLLAHGLRLTRCDELDCAQFLRLLPRHAHGALDDRSLEERMLHHRELCPECDEERALLLKALGRT